MSKVDLEKAKDTLTKAVSLGEAVQELLAVYASGVMDGYRLGGSDEEVQETPCSDG